MKKLGWINSIKLYLWWLSLKKSKLHNSLTKHPNKDEKFYREMLVETLILNGSSFKFRYVSNLPFNKANITFKEILVNLVNNLKVQ